MTVALQKYGEYGSVNELFFTIAKCLEQTTTFSMELNVQKARRLAEKMLTKIGPINRLERTLNHFAPDNIRGGLHYTFWNRFRLTNRPFNAAVAAEDDQITAQCKKTRNTFSRRIGTRTLVSDSNAVQWSGSRRESACRKNWPLANNNGVVGVD